MGLGSAGLAATPAYSAVTVTVTDVLNDAIAANDPQITIGADFALTDDIATINYDVEIIGGGHTIDADGNQAFRFNGMPSTSSGNEVSGGGADLFALNWGEAYVSWSVLGSSDAADTASIMFGDGVIETDDPDVGPLSDNGGATLTHALLSWSPAFNSGDPDAVDLPDTDQRGDARIQQGRLDIGAVEMAPPLPATGADATGALLFGGLVLLLGGALVATRTRARSLR